MNAIDRTLRLKATGMTAPLVREAQKHALLLKRIAEREAFENAPQRDRVSVLGVAACVLAAVGFWAVVVCWAVQP